MGNTWVKHLFSVILLSLPFTVLGQSSLVGTWLAKMTDPQGKETAFQFAMQADGNYSVDVGADGTLEIEGKYLVEGEKVTVWDVSGSYACPTDQKGIFTFKVEGDDLTFTTVSDSCAGRGGAVGDQTVMKRLK